MRVSPIDERTSAVLDVMRWVAALVVVLTHVNDQVFLSMAETPEESRTLAFMAWKLISASGNEAVIVFFVISGYLVGGAALAEFLRDGDIKLSNYLLRRCCAALGAVFVAGVLVLGAIVGAVRSVNEGGSAIESKVAAKLMSHMTKRSAKAKQPVIEFSKREKQVLELLAGGKTNRDIGAALFISESTVKFHVHAILSKLDASNRTEAVSMAVQHSKGKSSRRLLTEYAALRKR